jgi:hypothetical protein
MNDYGLCDASLGGASPGDLSTQRVNGKKENESKKRRKESKKFVKVDNSGVYEPQTLGSVGQYI